MRLPSLVFDKDISSNFKQYLQKEWIITNGLGGYASSTVLGINTRKYHGLLVASVDRASGRKVCMAKLDEEMNIGKNIYPLSASEFQNGIFPKGYMFLKSFSVSPFPKYTYSVEEVELRKTIFMPCEKNVAIVLYEVLNQSDFGIELRIFPLVNWRHYHSVIDRWKDSWKLTEEQKENLLRMDFGDGSLSIVSTRGDFSADGKWVEKVFYREEEKRGESSLDDYYQPGNFSVHVRARENVRFALTATAQSRKPSGPSILSETPIAMYDIDALYEKERKRRTDLLNRFYREHRDIHVKEWLNWMILATDTFIIRGSDPRESSVVAGYHWFEAWGRDAFISLPGLLLVARRFEDARRVFLTFKNYCKQGLIPNFIPERVGEPAYNTVDATLWFVNAVLQYLKYTGDFTFVQRQLWETLQTIFKRHFEGTDFNIYVDSDGLLCHGPQLTWMDAIVNKEMITPRAGKAVEVQALWYNALKVMQLLAKKFENGEKATNYAKMAERTRMSFVDKFWDDQNRCLFDLIDEEYRDDSLRPNQVIAVSLDFAMLDKTKEERIVEVVQSQLLTPYGLRTLSQDDPRYRGVYDGDRRIRDMAYHNGAVWPWLLGPFTTAFLKVKGHSEQSREYAFRNFLVRLLSDQISLCGLGTLNELFDGKPPHTPRGCIAQAWSVAEPLRAYIEDVLLFRPRHEERILKTCEAS